MQTLKLTKIAIKKLLKNGGKTYLTSILYFDSSANNIEETN